MAEQSTPAPCPLSVCLSEASPFADDARRPTGRASDGPKGLPKPSHSDKRLRERRPNKKALRGGEQTGRRAILSAREQRAKIAAMHRTRHESLDFLGNANEGAGLPPHEEWAAFLSTSMTALATTDDEPETESPNRQRHAASADASPFGKSLAVDTFDGNSRNSRDAFNGGDDVTVPGFLGGTGGGSGTRKPRGGSMSESLTSSTGSSPSGVAWRPLGRRLTAPHIQPPVTSSASSSSLSSTASMTENQLEHTLEAAAAATAPPTFMRLASSPALSTGSHRSAPRQLKHSASLRDVVTSCLSSSGSSFYDSSSSSSSDDETAGQGDAGKPAGDQSGATGEIPTPGGSVRPGIIDVDPSYAESCLPVLSALPGSKMAGEGGALSRSNSLAHVKSPVLSSRKDSATWQLQDEEFITSPRFGSLRGNNQLDSPPPPPMGMFGRSSGSFMQEYVNFGPFMCCSLRW